MMCCTLGMDGLYKELESLGIWINWGYRVWMGSLFGWETQRISRLAGLQDRTGSSGTILRKDGYVYLFISINSTYRLVFI